MRGKWRFVTCRVFSFGLPTRGDEDWRECTAGPVFLVQRRDFMPKNMGAYDYDHDTETLHEEFSEWEHSTNAEYAAGCVMVDEDGCKLAEPKGPAVTEEELVKREDGEYIWITQHAWFTRKTAQAWVDAKKHRGVHRVWSVPSEGRLATLLMGRTKYDKTHTRAPNVSLEVRI